MKPKLSAGDLMLYYRLENKFFPSDVLVYHKDGKQFCGKNHGMPGDEIEIPDEGGLKNQRQYAGRGRYFLFHPAL